MVAAPAFFPASLDGNKEGKGWNWVDSPEEAGYDSGIDSAFCLALARHLDLKLSCQDHSVLEAWSSHGISIVPVAHLPASSEAAAPFCHPSSWLLASRMRLPSRGRSFSGKRSFVVTGGLCPTAAQHPSTNGFKSPRGESTGASARKVASPDRNGYPPYKPCTTENEK